MIVKMYMTTAVQTVDPSATPRQAAALMREKRVRRLVVVEDDKIAGIVCHRDVSNAYNVEKASGKKAANVRMIMNAPVISVGQEEPIEKAARLMTRHHIGGLPVVNHGALAGIITESDIFRALAALLSIEGDAVRITFDLTEGDDVLGYLSAQTRELELELLSFLNFEDGERRMAVARVRGEKVSTLVDELWDSGHSVVNIIR